jgi:hypothetical protein
MRTIRRAFELLGLDGSLLRHGIRRETFLAPTASNYRRFPRGEDARPDYYARPLSFLSEEFLKRWLVPRSMRIDDWRDWKRRDTWKQIAENTGWVMNLIAF